MLYDIVEVKFIKNHTLFLRFENDVEGEVDVSKILPFEGIFKKLKNTQYFATVHLNQELGTIVWDNGADISPCFLYSVITEQVA